MRRKQQEIMDPRKIEAILQQSRVGRLATLGADGYPYITPLNYVFWQGAVYFHCALDGEKLDNIARHDKVCFAVDIPLAYLDAAYSASPCDAGQFYQSVLIRGRAELVNNTVEKVGALNALMACHEGVADYAEVTAETPAVARCAVVAVRVDTLSAKAGLAQGKSGAEREKLRSYLTTRGLPGDRETVELLGS